MGLPSGSAGHVILWQGWKASQVGLMLSNMTTASMLLLT